MAASDARSRSRDWDSPPSGSMLRPVSALASRPFALSGSTASSAAIRPHSAGIAGPIVVEAVRDMLLGVELPFQALE